MGLPSTSIKSSQVQKSKISDSGELCNAYAPLQNLQDEETEILGDFTTQKLNFDLEHPVDILTQYSYDGSVNMVLNDGKNPTRLVNSRFSVQNDVNFKIPEHYGFKDTNIYDESTFAIDTNLKPIPIQIPEVHFNGLLEESGNMACGAYTFFFKFSDADGNETEVVAESGMVYNHVGHLNDPDSMRMGMQDENTNKAIKFTLANIDAGFDYVHVLYARTSSGINALPATTFHKVIKDYPIWDHKCEIVITGNEPILGSSANEVYADYADIEAVKTHDLINNILVLGNCKKIEHDWNELRKLTWQIKVGYKSEPVVGSVTRDYIDTMTCETETKLGYYNTHNLYNRVGYWPDEIYRIGIVYIFEDNSLSPVFCLQGLDFEAMRQAGYATVQDTWLFDGGMPNTKLENMYFPREFEEKDYWFSNNSPIPNLRLNSRGVFKMPKISNIQGSGSGTMTPKPLYLTFDFSLIGKYSAEKDKTYKEIFADHKIKGYFFVRQKRVPTILGQGVVVGLTDKDRGSLPMLKGNTDKYVYQSFLQTDTSEKSKKSEDPIRVLLPEAKDMEMEDKGQISNQALLMPEAEMLEPIYNGLFVSNDYMLDKVAEYSFKFDSDTHTAYPVRLSYNVEPISYKTKLTNVPENPMPITNGEDYFATRAGLPDEPYKTEDVEKRWRWTPPQDLTLSTTLVRGQWGPYVGLGKPGDGIECPFQYGDVYNIKQANYYDDPEAATDLDFQKRFTKADVFHAICDRRPIEKEINCYRGDCYTSMFTHRMFRNFIDQELPTNTKIVNPACWDENYAVRCTAEILDRTHSNLTKDSAGFVIPSPAKDLSVLTFLNKLLTGNLVGAILQLVSKKVAMKRVQDQIDADYEKALQEEAAQVQNNNIENCVSTTLIEPGTYKALSTGTMESDPKGTITIADGSYYTLYTFREEDPNQNIFIDPEDFSLGIKPGLRFENILVQDIESANIKYYSVITYDEDGNEVTFYYSTKFVKVADLWTGSKEVSEAVKHKYPYGMANEIVKTFEVYIPDSAKKWAQKKKHKVEPKEMESDQKGMNLKAIFKSEANWKLRGLASINRADVNAVGLGQWITFPICGTHNFALRDVDAYQSTEEATFMRKRSFYPLHKKVLQDPLRDSNVINAATGISIPDKGYNALPDVPFLKQEYFTRIYNSLIDNTNSISNELKFVLENAYRDYTKQHGQITKVIAMNNALYVVFSHGIGVIQQIPTGQTADKFLPEISIIEQDLGSLWKDSIITTEYGIYGLDSVAKCIWKCAGTQVAPISTMKVEKFLIDNLDMSEFTRNPYIGHINIKTHFNKFKRDIMFTYYNDEAYKKGTDERIYFKEDETIDWREIEWRPGKTWSLCYNEINQVFTTFYDWIPLESENIDHTYFSFDREKANTIYTEPINSLDLSAQILVPDFTAGKYKYKVTPNNGFLYNIKKDDVDITFNHKIPIYEIYAQHHVRPILNLTTTNILEANKIYGFGFYYRNTKECTLKLKSGASLNQNEIYSIVFNNNFDTNIQLPESSPGKEKEWKFKFVILKPNQNISDLHVFMYSQRQSDFAVADWYLREIKEGDEIDVLAGNWIKENMKNSQIMSYPTHIHQWKDIYPMRDTSHSLKLWKHGQSGVYDNQGKIKPTHWYGKQHEFNFEFIVNDGMLHKIFDNLQMISNKAAPDRFEYEVVGEAYDWFEYKAIIVWANLHAKDFGTLEDAYKYILQTPYKQIRNNHSDFPELFGKDDNFIIPKLPFLKLELVNRKKGTKGLPQYYLEDPKADSYKDNSDQTILVYDELLNECKVHTEQLGNDVKKYGRLRGNMHYLEDIWRIEIRPVYFKFAYIKGGELAFTDLRETRLRDKYIKIKIIYPGTDLAVIAMINTIYTDSQA